MNFANAVVNEIGNQINQHQGGGGHYGGHSGGGGHGGGGNGHHGAPGGGDGGHHAAPPAAHAGGVQPTSEELRDPRLAVQRLWSLDTNRLQPGKDLPTLNLQSRTYSSDNFDKADEPLFKDADPKILFANRPTYAGFVRNIDNYHSRGGVAESFSQEHLQDQAVFMDQICRTPVIQYLHNYLVARNTPGVEADMNSFQKHLQHLWFGLYKRVVPNDSSAFEHAFVVEERDGQVLGFHNWITFLILEKRGLADYRGFIPPRRRPGHNSNIPHGDEHVLAIQLSWKGEVKPISTFLIAVSPEYELALYTLCFYAGREEGGSGSVSIPFDIDGIECEVIVHRFHNREGIKIGSAYVKLL